MYLELLRAEIPLHPFHDGLNAHHPRLLGRRGRKTPFDGFAGGSDGLTCSTLHLVISAELNRGGKCVACLQTDTSSIESPTTDQSMSSRFRYVGLEISSCTLEYARGRLTTA